MFFKSEKNEKYVFSNTGDHQDINSGNHRVTNYIVLPVKLSTGPRSFAVARPIPSATVYMNRLSA